MKTGCQASEEWAWAKIIMKSGISANSGKLVKFCELFHFAQQRYLDYFAYDVLKTHFSVTPEHVQLDSQA